MNILSQVYKSIFTRNNVALQTQDGGRAKIHSEGEVLLLNAFNPALDPDIVQHLRDDDEGNVLSEAVLLFVNADADDDSSVKVKYRNGVNNIIKVWKLKASCTDIIKVFDTGTDLTNDEMFLSK